MSQRDQQDAACEECRSRRLQIRGNGEAINAPSLPQASSSGVPVVQERMKISFQRSISPAEAWPRWSLHPPLFPQFPPAPCLTAHRARLGEESELETTTLRTRTPVSFQLTAPSFDHDYRLLRLGAGVFLSKRHPAEGPSIISGKSDRLNAVPQQQQNLSTTDAAVQAACFETCFCSAAFQEEGCLWKPRVT